MNRRSSGSESTIVRTAVVTIPRTESAADDAALVARVLGGEQSALEALYDRYARPCYALARRVVADPVIAEDVVQEVFLAVWRDPSRFDAARGSFSSWLLSATHHKAVDAVRREENHRKRRAGTEGLEVREAREPAVEEQVWQAVRRTEVRAALAALPDAQRQALDLAYFGGYTQREIAGLTGIPLGTVKTRMLAGTRRLRALLSGVVDDSATGATS